MPSLIGICKTVAISGLFLYLISVFLFNDRPDCPPSEVFSSLRLSRRSTADSPTNVSHMVFGLVGSVKAWNYRRPYIESWWRPNVTRGYLFLDTVPSDDLLPWPPSSPAYRVSEDISKLLEESNHVAPVAARILHAVSEVFREEHGGGIRWYVMGDDDSVFFLENIVDVLGQYDHTKYVYIGGHSESILPNFIHSFSMGFGGAGLILSYPLAKAVAKDMENCLRRYAYLVAADQTLMSCISDLGVSLTAHKGIHQIDLHNDLSGFLSSHPQAPLLSLHHYDMVDPIFPSMSRAESGDRLMKAAEADQSRLLQQTVCYHRPTNWSFSISWGYSVHIYENIIARSILKRPLETFRPWVKKARPPLFIFNTRWPNNDPCETPHWFFFNGSVEYDAAAGGRFVTSYVRSWLRGLPTCSPAGNHSADYINRIQVFSPAAKLVDYARSECCDIVHVNGTDLAEARYRACMKDEIIA